MEGTVESRWTIGNTSRSPADGYIHWPLAMAPGDDDDDDDNDDGRAHRSRAHGIVPLFAATARSSRRPASLRRIPVRAFSSVRQGRPGQGCHHTYNTFLPPRRRARSLSAPRPRLLPAPDQPRRIGNSVVLGTASGRRKRSRPARSCLPCSPTLQTSAP